MKKLLLTLIVAVSCLMVNPAKIHAQTFSVDRPLIWGASPFQDSLWAYDTLTGQIVYRIAPSLASNTITGINGLATDPTTGITYCIMKVSAVTGRVLGTIDLMTGVCTQIGNLGDNFSSITFDETGQLWGATGNGAVVPETLYKIDKSNGTTTLWFAMGNGVDGEIICYNRSDDKMYHWSGNGTVVYESWPISSTTYAYTDIPHGTTSGETFGAMYLNPNTFIISNISSSLNHIGTNGTVSSSYASLPDDWRGLVLLPYFTISNDTICQNEMITLNGGGHQLYDNYIYHWGDGNSDTLANAYGVLTAGSHQYATGGNYTIHVETDNGFGGDTVYTMQIHVNNPPVVAISGPSVICSGDSVTLTATSGGTSQWYMNGTLIPGATSNTYSTNVQGVYNMIKTNLNGCADSAAVGATLTIGAYPVVALGNDTAACQMYTVDAGNPGSAYAWSTGDTTQTILVTASSAVSVTVTNVTGCTAADSISITIHSLPSVNVGPDTTVCGSITLDAGNPGAFYLWCTGATTQTVTFSSGGTCAVMVTDSNGCVGGDTISLTVNPNPIVNLGPDAAACTMVVITADSSLIGGTFLWCTGGTGLNEVITTSTTCDLQYTDVNGCMGFDTINVTIYGNPTVAATASTLNPCVDDANVTLTGTPAGGTFSGTSVTGTQFDPSIGAGTYSIVYTYVDPNGCSGMDTVSINVNACVGIAENNAAAFQAFPNPTTGILNITNASIGANVEVFDVLGNVVASKKVTASGTQLDLSNQSNGVYFVRVSNGAAQSVQRVVLQR